MVQGSEVKHQIGLICYGKSQQKQPLKPAVRKSTKCEGARVWVQHRTSRAQRWDQGLPWMVCVTIGSIVTKSRTQPTSICQLILAFTLKSWNLSVSSWNLSVSRISRSGLTWVHQELDAAQVRQEVDGVVRVPDSARLHGAVRVPGSTLVTYVAMK
jgi:hypothetical protein